MPFSATWEAERWIHSLGYSVGALCALHPRVIKFGSVLIKGWTSLSPVEQANNSGVMMSDDYRNGNVTVYLIYTPEE